MLPLRLTAFNGNHETGVAISVLEATLPEDKENRELQQQQQREAQKRKNSPRAPLRAISSVFSFSVFCLYPRHQNTCIRSFIALCCLLPDVCCFVR